MIFDLHCHTTASPDGHDDIFTLVSHAVELGIDMLAITEHCHGKNTVPKLLGRMLQNLHI
jgi:predicted metal-dependent phosphoesterase TrpH